MPKLIPQNELDVVQAAVARFAEGASIKSGFDYSVFGRIYAIFTIFQTFSDAAMEFGSASVI